MNEPSKKEKKKINRKKKFNKFQLKIGSFESTINSSIS